MNIVALQVVPGNKGGDFFLASALALLAFLVLQYKKEIDF